MTVEVLPKQTLIDIAMQQYGNALRVSDMAFEMDCSITYELTAGALTVPDFTDLTAKENGIRKALVKNKPASATEADTQQEGIGYWIIGLNFKVT